MTHILVGLGVLILTYWVSRATHRAVSVAQLAPWPQLLAAHAISFVLIALFVVLMGANDVNAPLPYLPAQIFWLGVDWFQTSRVALPSRRRRRRSSNMASGTHRPSGNFQPPKWLIPVAMGVLTIAFVAYGWRIFAYEAISYHDVIIGTSPRDTIYAAGKPAFGRNSDSEPWRPIAGDPQQYSQWLYRQPLMAVRFAPEHYVTDVRCSNNDKIQESACLSTLAINVGTTEGQLYEKLGIAPAGGTTADGKRVASYPEIGHDFVLEQFTVRALHVYPSNGNTLAKLWRFFLWLVP